MTSFGESRQLIDAVRGIIQVAILTEVAVDDPDSRFRRPFGSGWKFMVVHSHMDAYSAAPATYRFVPTARDISRMETVMTWLAWLRRIDESGFRRMWTWALGYPVWLLAQREQVTPRTIRNRIDRDVVRIINWLTDGDLFLKEVMEKQTPDDRHFRVQAAYYSASGTVQQHGKVWIGGKGFMRRGRRLRTAQEHGAEP